MELHVIICIFHTESVTKQNSIKDGQILQPKNGEPTEAPVIIDGSTYHVPGTDVTGESLL